VSERNHGPDHGDTLECVDNLAALLWDRDKLAEAKPLLCRSLETRQRTLGPKHQDTLESVEKLAKLLRDMRSGGNSLLLHRWHDPEHRKLQGTRSHGLGLKVMQTPWDCKGKGELGGCRGVGGGEIGPCYRCTEEGCDFSLCEECGEEAQQPQPPLPTTFKPNVVDSKDALMYVGIMAALASIYSECGMAWNSSDLYAAGSMPKIAMVTAGAVGGLLGRLREAKVRLLL